MHCCCFVRSIVEYMNRMTGFTPVHVDGLLHSSRLPCHSGGVDDNANCYLFRSFGDLV